MLIIDRQTFCCAFITRRDEEDAVQLAVDAGNPSLPRKLMGLIFVSAATEDWVYCLLLLANCALAIVETAAQLAAAAPVGVTCSCQMVSPFCS